MKHSIWFRLAKSFREGQAVLHAELQQDPGHVLNVIHRLAYGVPLSVAALNNGANSQISTFLQRLNFHRQDISCHPANIVAENGYKFNFDYYPCRDALGLRLDCHWEPKLRAERGGSVAISFGGSRSILGEKAHLKSKMR